jgi:hypothetical protein
MSASPLSRWLCAGKTFVMSVIIGASFGGATEQNLAATQLKLDADDLPGSMR